MRKSLQRIPCLVPVEHWVCSSPVSCRRKTAFKPSPCKDSCEITSSELGQGHACTIPTSRAACPSSTFGGTWDPPSPASPSREGSLGLQHYLPSMWDQFLTSSSDRQTNKHLLETEIFLQLLYFPTFLITN